MIRGLTVLLLCQFVGSLLVALTALPVPGPVAGMVLLLGWLVWRRPGPGAGVVRAADGLLEHLQLLFVPAGVGVVAYLAVLGEHAAPVVVSLLLSWLAGLLVVGWIVQGALVLRRGRGRGRAPGGPGRAPGAGLADGLGDGLGVGEGSDA